MDDVMDKIDAIIIHHPNVDDRFIQLFQESLNDEGEYRIVDTISSQYIEEGSVVLYKVMPWKEMLPVIEPYKTYNELTIQTQYTYRTPPILTVMET